MKLRENPGVSVISGQEGGRLGVKHKHGGLFRDCDWLRGERGSSDWLHHVFTQLRDVEPLLLAFADTVRKLPRSQAVRARIRYFVVGTFNQTWSVAKDFHPTPPDAREFTLTFYAIKRFSLGVACSTLTTWDPSYDVNLLT